MAVDTEEELYDVPSEYITGCEERKTHPSLNEFSLSDYAKRLIFDSFRKMIGADSRGSNGAVITLRPYTITRPAKKGAETAIWVSARPMPRLPGIR